MFVSTQFLRSSPSASDDANVVVRTFRMAETIDTVSERLTRLEVTVAQGFHESAARDAALDRKIDAVAETLNRKIDASTDVIREDIRAFKEEVRRSNDAIRLILVDHSRRLTDLEKK